jgi:hypothetical protein
MEIVDVPAISFRVLTDRQHDFCFSSIADLARLSKTITHHAAGLVAKWKGRQPTMWRRGRPGAS